MSAGFHGCDFGSEYGKMGFDGFDSACYYGRLLTLNIDLDQGGWIRCEILGQSVRVSLRHCTAWSAILANMG